MTDKIALITGASRGLGTALAKALAPTHHIVAVARTVGGLEELDDAITQAGGTATLAPMDITKPDAMAQLCRSIHDRWGGIALWVHTAIHAAPLTPVAHMDAKDWTNSVAGNVTPLGHLIPYIAPLLGVTGKPYSLTTQRRRRCITAPTGRAKLPRSPSPAPGLRKARSPAPRSTF